MMTNVREQRERERERETSNAEVLPHISSPTKLPTGASTGFNECLRLQGRDCSQRPRRHKI